MLPGFSSELMPKGHEKESQAKIKRYMTMMDSMTNADLEQDEGAQDTKERRDECSVPQHERSAHELGASPADAKADRWHGWDQRKWVECLEPWVEIGRISPRLEGPVPDEHIYSHTTHQNHSSPTSTDNRGGRSIRSDDQSTATTG
ncbi:hypothetical protein EJB05_16792, partial [Eragrostis curvula]